MTPENKKVVKIIVVSVGVAMILTVITILIVKQVRNSREENDTDSESGDPAPSKSNQTSSSSGSGSMNTLNGRTFTKIEIEKMQSFLFNMGAMAMNELIVSKIRDSGGIDGKIGTGFKAAFNEAIRINIVKNLDDLYTQAMRH
jgi:hypothetical protein